MGIIFPPAILGSAIVGAGAGGLVGHLSRGISRGDLKELGEELDAGTAAVIVLGESKIEEQLEKAMTRANKLIEKQVDADADELEREIDAAAREGAKLGGDSASPRLPRTRARRRRRLARSRDQGATLVAGALVLTGTLFYWRFEDWTIIEALYFCVVTLTTVGYGDLAPTSAGTQLFTIVYILTGFGVLVALLTSVAEKYIEQKAEARRATTPARPSTPGRAGRGPTGLAPPRWSNRDFMPSGRCRPV